MTRFLQFVFVVVFTTVPRANAQYADDVPRRNQALSAEEITQVLKAMGQTMHKSLDAFSLSDEELESFIVGLREAQKNPTAPIDEHGLARVKEFEMVRRSKRQAAERDRGNKFLDEAKKEKGATVLPSGVVFISVLEGQGLGPTPRDEVKVHYRGTLADGREFDSSYKRGPAVVFGVSQVVPCFSQALQKMKPGGRAKFVCPANTAYGDKGTQGIPPGAVLQFEVELIEVKSALLQRRETNE
jgi:FKBP-type peptidyl-prolyl cis-trans isomerase FkpA